MSRLIEAVLSPAGLVINDYSVRMTEIPGGFRMMVTRASEAPELFPAIKVDGSLIKTGTRINWNGTIKKAKVDLWAMEINDPDHAPDLWADIDYRDGIRIIPEIITVTTAFAAGELGWWGDVIYRSKADANVFTPSQYPDNWEIYKKEG